MIGGTNISSLTAEQRTELGSNIKNARTEKGISQATLAKELSCYNTYVSMLEKGRYTCDLDSLEQIAQILSVKITTLANKNILNEMRKRKMENAEKEAQEIIDTTPAEINTEIVSSPEVETAEVTTPEMSETAEVTVPNIEIPEFIMSKVNENNHHNINMTDIIVAGLNYFAILPAEAQIHHVMTYTGNKQYFNDIVNHCLANGDYARAKQMIDVLEKIK